MTKKQQNEVRLAVVIPAAGIGSRMQSDKPKQYLNVLGKSIIEYAISPFLNHPLIHHVVVVLHPDDHDFSQLPISQHPKIKTTIGGKERADSVLAGLAVLADVDWVLVHDAARPCLRQSDLQHLIDKGLASEHGAILASPVTDTIKLSTAQQCIEMTMDRQRLWRAYTPQIFPYSLLKACLTKGINKKLLITDEASSLEFEGYSPLLILGRSDNIKLTHPEELALVKFYLMHDEGCR